MKNKLRSNPSRLRDAPTRVKDGSPTRRARPTANARGYGYEWQQARAEYLAEHPLCVHCQSLGLVTAATVVDHITPHRGDPVLFWSRSNWQALCATCHSAWKQKQEQDKPQRVRPSMRRGDVIPAPPTSKDEGEGWGLVRGMVDT